MNKYVSELQKKCERIYRGIYSEEERYKDNLLKELGVGEDEIKVPLTKEELNRLVVNKIKIVEKRASPRILQKVSQKIMEDPTFKLEPLVSIGKRISGNLFDRVKFLRERIGEVERLIEERKELHQKLIEEMEKDIKDRERLLGGISDPDKVREHKLDISLLKMERRKENMLFWRDILTLKKELQELKEEYENEVKIASLFDELNLGG